MLIKTVGLCTILWVKNLSFTKLEYIAQSHTTSTLLVFYQICPSLKTMPLTLYHNVLLISWLIVGKCNTMEGMWVKMKYHCFICFLEDPVSSKDLHLRLMSVWVKKYWSRDSKSLTSLREELFGAFLPGYSTHHRPLPIDPHQLDLHHQLLCQKVSHPLFLGQRSEIIDYHGPSHTASCGCRNWVLKKLSELPRIIGIFNPTVFWLSFYCTPSRCPQNTNHFK